MITCPRCGYQAPDGSLYCPHCGYGRQQVPPMQSDPPKEPKKKKSPNILLWICLFFIALLVAGVYFLNESNQRNLFRSVMFQKTVISQSTELASLQQTVTAQSFIPSTEPTITPTQKAAVPDLCKDKQMDLINLANVLDAEGFPYPADYDPDENICLYRITDDDSFLGWGTFGYFSILHDQADRPNGIVVMIDYKDNEQIRELIRDWGAVAISYLDPGTDVLSAIAALRSIMQTGIGEVGKVSVIAGLDTQKMQYQVAVMADE